MTIHREGIKTLTGFIVLLVIVNTLLYSILELGLFFFSLLALSLAGLVFVLWFFRRPYRPRPDGDGLIIAPADGTVIGIEDVFVNEFFQDHRIRVSIFMSGKDVHMNWIPVSGYIRYQRYNPGIHLLARHPKSSDLNERSTVLIEDLDGRQVMVRQIAGMMARRVVTYPRPGEDVAIGDELGFIKFGSRVDIFLPKEADIHVSPGQKTKGRITPIASL